jgi:hypothetical protein
MNQIIVTRPLNSYEVGEHDAAVHVINTELSAPEFDAVFRDAINNYIEGYGSFDETINRLLQAAQNAEDTAEHVVALDSFNVEFEKQQAFVAAHKVFEHNGQKIVLPAFTENDKIPTEFEVMFLSEWLEMKTEETTTGFKSE